MVNLDRSSPSATHFWETARRTVVNVFEHFSRGVPTTILLFRIAISLTATYKAHATYADVKMDSATAKRLSSVRVRVEQLTTVHERPRGVDDHTRHRSQSSSRESAQLALQTPARNSLPDQSDHPISLASTTPLTFIAVQYSLPSPVYGATA